MKALGFMVAMVPFVVGAEITFAQKSAPKQPQEVQLVPIVPGRAVSVGRSPDNPLDLLRNSRIREELKIGEDQTTEIFNMITEWTKKNDAEIDKIDPNLGIRERSKKIMELSAKSNKETTKVVQGILKPEQRARLSQIQMQIQGNRAYLRLSVHKPLKVTAEQAAKLTAVYVEMYKARRQLYKDLLATRRLNPTIAAAENQKLDAKELKDVRAVLTDSQRKQFDAMKGKPFDMSRRGRIFVPGIEGRFNGRNRLGRARPKAARPGK